MVETSGYPSASVSLPPVTAALTTALRAFLLAVLPPDMPVLLARQNRMPAPNGPFALMAVLLHQPVATSATRYTATSRIILQQQEVTVQVSLFGQGAADNLHRISTLFQNGWAAEFFTAFQQSAPAPAASAPSARLLASPADIPRIAPLYAGSARQLPFVNGEQQYEEHWQIDLHLQASFAVSLPQSMASAARLVLAGRHQFTGFFFRMTLPISSLVTVTPGVLSPGGTVSLLNGMVFSQNVALSSGVSSFASAEEVSAVCGATSVEASIASIYFSAYTNAQDTPEKLYFFQLPATPVAEEYGTYLSTAADQATDWSPFLFASEPEPAAKIQIATWLAAHPNRYWGVVQDSDASILSANATTSFGATVAAASTPGLTCLCNAQNNSGTLAAALCLGWAASLNPNRVGGRTTLMFRNNSAVLPLASLTASQAQALLGNGYSFYGSYKSTDSTFSFLNNGAVSGPFSWADSYINQIWMNASFQNDLITLFSSAGQIPYNAVGDSLIATAVQSTIDTALSFGAIQPNVTLSDAQKQAVNADAGRSIDTVLSTRGWYLLPGASTTSAAVRAARGTVQGRFFYMDGQSVQSIALASVEAQ